MPTFFADTSFWIALSSRRDQHHLRAVAWRRFVIRNNYTLVTTEAVLWEWMNAFSDATVRDLAARGYRHCNADAQIHVIPFDASLIESAVTLYSGRTDKTWSLTDCLSFVVMQHEHLTGALTTDRHFEQAGLRAMMLQQTPG